MSASQIAFSMTWILLASHIAFSMIWIQIASQIACASLVNDTVLCGWDQEAV
jgi:hypothetical protein